ncbi:MAG: glycosyltransferase [Pseudomonadota bacterium]
MDNGRSELVSVLLATHNRADRVSAAIESVLAQRHSDLELLVIDDASTDHTPEVLAQWSDDPRIRCFRNEQNQRLPTALNRIASEARGPFLARIDDDDHWTDAEKLTAQLAWMRMHQDGVLVGTGYVDEWGRETHNPSDDESIRRQMNLRCPLCHPTVLMRRDAFEAVGGYDTTLPYAEDWELWMRLGQAGRLGNLERITLVKARGGDTLSERYFEEQLLLATQLLKRHGDAYPGVGRARVMHAFNRGFFRCFPVGGRMHRVAASTFRRVFDLE